MFGCRDECPLIYRAQCVRCNFLAPADVAVICVDVFALTRAVVILRQKLKRPSIDFFICGLIQDASPLVVSHQTTVYHPCQLFLIHPHTYSKHKPSPSACVYDEYESPVLIDGCCVPAINF